MKKSMLLFTLLVLVVDLGYGQKYFTRDGRISFLSKAPLEDIEAHNAKATSVLDWETNRVEFAVLIKAFQFEKALMQEHFNENYLESSKFPKATFKGRMEGLDEVDISKDGRYDVEVRGDMTIHGVTKPLTTPGTITIENGQISANAAFDITVADYDIEIPAIVRENIAKVVKVVVDISYQPLKK